jgi:hypothetical protein
LEELENDLKTTGTNLENIAAGVDLSPLREQEEENLIYWRSFLHC